MSVWKSFDPAWLCKRNGAKSLLWDQQGRRSCNKKQDLKIVAWSLPIFPSVAYGVGLRSNLTHPRQTDDVWQARRRICRFYWLLLSALVWTPAWFNFTLVLFTGKSWVYFTGKFGKDDVLWPWKYWHRVTKFAPQKFIIGAYLHFIFRVSTLYGNWDMKCR